MFAQAAKDGPDGVVCLFVKRGPGDSKLLCGPTTRNKVRGDEIAREERRLEQR